MGAPTLRISESGTQVSGNATIKIMNPLNEELVAATIFCEFTSSLSAQIQSGLNLTGDLSELTLTVTDVKPLFAS